MPRTVQISLPAASAGRLVRALEQAEGIIAIQHQPGASVRPAGDVVSAYATDEGLSELQRILDGFDLEHAAVATTEPQSLVAPSYENQLDDETNEATLEEMASMLRRETNVSNNYLMAMGFSGGVAAAGLWTDTLHIIVGAMVIAPGFEPVLRIPFGLIAIGKPRARRGIYSTAAGYGVMFLGAVITTWVLVLIGGNADVPLAERQWVRFWTTLQPAGVLIALLASAAGMAIVAAQRSVLSAGVMIALALVPGMTIFGMGVAVGEFALAGWGLLRWAVDAVAVVAAGALVLAAKIALLHRRSSAG